MQNDLKLLLFVLIISMFGACSANEPTPKKEQATQEKKEQAKLEMVQAQNEIVTDSMIEYRDYCYSLQLNGSSCLNDSSESGVRLKVNFMGVNYDYTIRPYREYKAIVERKFYRNPSNYIARSYHRKLDITQIMTDLNSVHFESWQKDTIEYAEQNRFYLEIMQNGEYSCKKGWLRERKTNKVNPMFTYILKSFRLDSTEYKWALEPSLPTLEFKDGSE